MQNNKGGGAPRLKKIYIRTMNSDKNSIQNQGGGEPKPFKPSEGGGNQGSTPNQNQSPKPQSPGQGQQGNQSPKPSGGDSSNPTSPGMPGTSNAGQSPKPQQGGGGIQKPKGPGEEGDNNDTIPSPPGGDSNFQENFSQSKGQGKQSSGAGMQQGQQNNLGQSDASGGDQPPMQPPQDFDQSDIEGDQYPPEDKSNKKLFIILLIVILALGAAVAVYFLFLSPSEQPTTPAVDDTQNQQQEQVDDETSTTTDEENNEQNGSVGVPTVPSATSSDENQADQTTNEDQQETDETQTSEIPADSHESLLSTSADNEESVTLSSVSLSSITSELDQSATETALFTEWVLQDESNNLVTFNQLASMLSPTVFTDGVASQFNQDATVITYTNDQGSWFGIVASLDQEADAQAVKDQVSSIEGNISEVKNFFFSDPGAQGSWADGGAGDVTSRYITFGDGNAAFNYGWSGDTLVIGTSYSTFQQIVNHL